MKFDISLLLSTILSAVPVIKTVLSFNALWRGIIGRECFGIMYTICTIFYRPDDLVLLPLEEVLGSSLGHCHSFSSPT